MSNHPVAIRCEGIGKRFLLNYTDPYHGLRAKLAGMLPGARPNAAPVGLWALRDVSFEIPPGGVFGVVGSNGSGKSILLRILARVTKPTTGRAEVHGAIGSILQLGAMLVPDLTGRENIYQIGTLLRLSRAAIDRHFDEIIDFSGIESQLDSLVRAYSAGMQLRLAFAVFAYLDSDVLLLDEALSVADEDFRIRCIERIRGMAARGKTIVVVSHEMAMMADLCDQILVMDHGRLQAFGDARDIVGKYLDHQFAGTGGPRTGIQP
jgi:lipopolysaccharide transport system ATP-binding protein